MTRPTSAASSTVLIAGALLALSACADTPDDSSASPTQAEAATGTVTVDETTMPDAPASESSMQTSVAVSGFAEKIVHLPQVVPAPYASSHIFPQQPGFQFTGPDGTYCEVYGQVEGAVDEVTAMCTHSGEGDVNAVSVAPGQPATTHHVNRIFVPHEETRALEPGTRLTAGAVACGVPEGEVAVTCAFGTHGFTVSTGGAETG